jgi:hypothetical protein
MSQSLLGLDVIGLMIDELYALTSDIEISLSSVVERYTSIQYWYVAVARSIRVARILFALFLPCNTRRIIGSLYVAVSILKLISGSRYIYQTSLTETGASLRCSSEPMTVLFDNKTSQVEYITY